jgi:protein-S-isoprenylcysteine O-methyltransferase Ste14
MSDATRRGVIRWLIRETVGTIIVAVAVFWSAGTLRWTWGWALVGLYAGWIIGAAVLLIPANPDLLAERATRRQGLKDWDARLMSVVALMILAQQIVGGLDYRYGWSAPLPLWAHLLALLTGAAGHTLVIWSMVANAYFSLIVRIQTDRGHQVVSGGPYRLVRHPGYLGSLIFYLSTAPLLGSWWALLPGGLAALLLIARTALEDRTLHAELPGYGDYAEKTRYRLLPGVW